MKNDVLLAIAWLSLFLRGFRIYRIIVATFFFSSLNIDCLAIIVWLIHFRSLSGHFIKEKIIFISFAKGKKETGASRKRRVYFFVLKN